MARKPIESATSFPKNLSEAIRCLIGLTLIVFVTLSTSMCTEHASGPGRDERHEKVLHIDVPTPFGSLVPSDDFDSGSTFVYAFLYSALFSPIAEGKLGPALAVAWDYAEDRNTWTVRIRDDVFFHDGRRVTATDVKSSLLRFSQQVYPAVFSEIEEISILSDHCLSITLRANDRDFPDKIRQIPITPASLEEQLSDQGQPVGSGPFKFSYRVGEKEVGLVPNERDYRGRPSIDKLLFHYVADSQVSWARLLKGETHIAHQITPKDWMMLAQYRGLFHFKIHALPNYTILLYNTSDPLFQSPTVRTAMTEAINREHLVKHILQGFGEVAAGPVWQHSPFHNAAITPIPYDPTHALELLKEEGWVRQPDGSLVKNGKIFEFTVFLFEGFEDHRKVAEYIQLCLNDLGVRARLQTLPYHQLTQKYIQNDEFQAVLTELNGLNECLRPIQRIWHATPERSAYVGAFSDLETNRLLHEAMEEDHPQRKRDLLHMFEARLSALQPGTFLYHPEAMSVISKRVGLLSDDASDEYGGLPSAFADVD